MFNCFRDGFVLGRQKPGVRAVFCYCACAGADRLDNRDSDLLRVGSASLERGGATSVMVSGYNLAALAVTIVAGCFVVWTLRSIIKLWL